VLGVHRSTIHRWIKSGLLHPDLRVGKRGVYLFTPRVLEKQIKGGKGENRGSQKGGGNR
jgi:DNA-binding transcriptional MerR regulator